MDDNRGHAVVGRQFACPSFNVHPAIIVVLPPVVGTSRADHCTAAHPRRGAIVVVPVLETAGDGDATSIGQGGGVTPQSGDVLILDAGSDLHELGDELIGVGEGGKHGYAAAVAAGAVHTICPVVAAVAESSVGEDVVLANIVPLESSKPAPEIVVTHVALAIRWRFGESGWAFGASIEKRRLVIDRTAFH